LFYYSAYIYKSRIIFFSLSACFTEFASIFPDISCHGIIDGNAARFGPLWPCGKGQLFGSRVGAGTFARGISTGNRAATARNVDL
jgi:hypothetical protein